MMMEDEDDDEERSPNEDEIQIKYGGSSSMDFT
jgi:hypothetical protein